MENYHPVPSFPDIMLLSIIETNFKISKSILLVWLNLNYLTPIKFRLPLIFAPKWGENSRERFLSGQFMVKRRLNNVKQRYFNVYNVYTTLFQRRLTMMCPLGWEPKLWEGWKLKGANWASKIGGAKIKGSELVTEIWKIWKIVLN